MKDPDLCKAFVAYLQGCNKAHDDEVHLHVPHVHAVFYTQPRDECVVVGLEAACVG